MASLSRPRHGRVVAGVCAAIGNRFGVSPLLVRVAFLVSMLLPGPQILIYIAGWVLIPDEKF
jgi:phage shock protein PspC (stress-responsive transcriptional regulator)